MPELRPFTGLLYDPAVAGPLDTLVAPPYDLISPVDQERYYRASPHNVVRLILGRDETADDGASNKYTRAATYLQAWRDRGILAETAAPSVFPFAFDFHLGGRRRMLRGLIAEVGLEPWGGSIIPHERTFAGPVEDRLRLLSSVRANLSPIYAVLTDGAASEPLGSFLDAATADPAEREVTDDAGTRHRLWVSRADVTPLQAALRGDRLMIADGHHRYTVALAYRDLMRPVAGPGPWDSTMMLIVDARSEVPPVLPIHRVLRGGTAPAPQGELVRDLAEVLATLADDDLTVGSVQLESGEVTHRVLQLRGGPPTVCALHEQVLDGLTGLDLGFVPDAVAAEREVLSGASPMAYLLPATTVDRVWEVIGSGEGCPRSRPTSGPSPGPAW